MRRLLKYPRPDGFTLLEVLVVVAILVLLASILVGGIGKIRDDAGVTASRSTLTTVRDAFTGSATSTGYLSDLKTVPGFDFTAIQMRDLLDSTHYPQACPYDPIAQRGWRGPYLSNTQPILNTNIARNGLFPTANERRTASDMTFLDRHFYDTSSHSYYGVAGDRAAADAWGNPIVVQIPPASEFTSTTNVAALRFHYARVVSAGPDGVLDTPLDRLGGMAPGGDITARGDDIVIFLNRADIYATEDQEQP